MKLGFMSDICKDIKHLKQSKYFMNKINVNCLRLFIFILGIGFFFTLSQILFPLYYSNQNQYFLFGLSKAQHGFLAGDWFVGTTDYTPVFTFLVFLIKRFLSEIWFYLFYFLLCSIYIWILIRISETIFKIKNNKTFYILLFSFIVFLHSAYFANISIDLFKINLSELLRDGFAGQYILSGYFQPSQFGVLIFVSIFAFLKKKYYLSSFLLALAVSFHPSLLLPASSIVLSYGLILYLTEKKYKKSLKIITFFILCILPIISFYFFFIKGINIPFDLHQQALQISAFIRQPHHTVIEYWFTPIQSLKLLIIISAIALTWRKKIFWILLIPFLISLFLSIIYYFNHAPLLALLFPWRVSVILAPLSTILIFSWLIKNISFNKKSWLIFCIINIFFILFLSIYGFNQTYREFHKKNDQESLFKYVKNQKNKGVYLIPISLEDFRIKTGMPILVDWKSMPLKNLDILEWNQRINLANQFYQSQYTNQDFILNLNKKYNVSFFVVKASIILDANYFSLIYQDSKFRIYQIR
jgi:hypothetical protein